MDDTTSNWPIKSRREAEGERGCVAGGRIVAALASMCE